MGRLGLWSYNVKTRELLWSSGVHKLLGTNPATDQPSMETFLRNVHPADRQRTFNNHELLKQGVVVDQKFRVIDAHGSLRWLTNRAEVLYDRGGSLFQITGLILDITDQESLLELFRRKDRQLDTLAESFQFSTWSADRTGALTAVPQWRSLGVSSSTQLLGWEWLKLMPACHREQARDTWQQAIAKREYFASSIRIAFSPETEPIRMLTYATPIFDDEGQVLEWAGLIARHCRAPDKLPSAHEIQAPHMRAARALLDWSIEHLSAKSGVSVSSIRRLESSETSAIRFRTLEVIKTTLEQGGVSFSGRGGRVSISLRA